MNYAALRRTLGFAVVMGGPEMARCPATPFIFQKLVELLSLVVVVVVEGGKFTGVQLDLGEGKDTPFAWLCAETAG